MKRSHTIVLFACLLLCTHTLLAESFRPISPLKSVRTELPQKKQWKQPIPQPVPALKMVATASSTALINKSAIKAIGKLLSTCGIGVWAGKIGILDQAALSVLSKLIFNIFQPCLLFVNVARTVANLSMGSNKGSVEAIYMLPLAALFQVVVGYGLGKLLSFIIYRGNTDCDEAKELMACTTFGNSGPLPLVFSEGLFHTNLDPTLVSRSAAYISLYLLGWSPVFWILGPAILQKKDTSGNIDPAAARKELLKRIFSPPVVASLSGMIVGFVPFLRSLILPGDGVFNVVYEAMRTLGSAYLPAVLLVLAGSLSPSSPSTSAAVAAPASEAKGKIDPQFALKVGFVYLSRFLLMPLIAFSLFRFGSASSPALNALFTKDRLLLFVLLLESCMPSAQNTTVILQLQGNKSGATKLARTLMMIYVLGVPAITFWLVQILKLTKLAG